MQFIRYQLTLFFLLCAGMFSMVMGQMGPDSLFKANEIFKVSVKQPFAFGTYSQGSTGGQVTIEPNGNRTVTGTLLPLNMGSVFHPLVIEVEAPRGSIVTMLNTGNYTLTGSHGGRMFLRIGNMEPGNPFYINNDPPQANLLFVGGVLSVGDAATTPAGHYSGDFFISFIME